MVYLSAGVTTWENAPTARHNNGATFAFADGHAERWGWKGLTGEPCGGAAANATDLKRVQDSMGQ